MPYRLKQDKMGFSIFDSSNVLYPLYLLIEAPLSPSDLETQKQKLERQVATKIKLRTIHQIRFEQAIILLDQNIQYLLFNFR